MRRWRSLVVVLTAGLLAAGSPAPAVAAETVEIPDAALRRCVTTALALGASEPIDPARAAGLVSLSCAAGPGPAIADLTGLEHFTGLKRLDLPGQQLSSLDALKGLPELAMLDLSGTTLAAVPDQLDLPRLTAVQLRGARLPSLGFLTGAPALTDLVLVGASGFPDLAPLSGLGSLGYLALGDNLGVDLSGLSALASVGSLQVETAAASMPALPQPLRLRRLGVKGLKLTDLRSIAGWRGVSDLRLETPLLPSLAALTGWDELATIWAPGTAPLSLKPLAGMAGLKTLQLNGRAVDSLEPLRGKPELFTLELPGSGITDLSPLAGSSALHSLSLGGNAISDLRPLAGLAGLRQLWLDSNSITDLTGLAGLNALEELSLDSNRITDLRPLSGLTSLTNLGLHNNQITDVTPLAALPDTTLIDLSKNRVADLRPLAGRTGRTFVGGQTVTFPDQVLGATGRLPIYAPDGKPPASLTGGEGTVYADGQIRYSLPGTMSLQFTYPTTEAFSFTGAIQVRVGPDQPFTPGKVSIDGVPNVGSDVVAHYGRWSPTPTSYQLQWYRETTAIPGATGEWYRATAADYGKRLRVRVTAMRNGYVTKRVYSDYTRKTLRGTFSASPRPKIQGTVKTGQKLTAVPGTWKPTPSRISYEWYRGGKAIRGATGRTYKLTAADLGRRIAVHVTVTAPAIEPGQSMSRSTAVVAKGPVRAATPRITGTAAVGRTLTAKPGSWGPGTVTLRYRWYRDGRPIASATGRSYRVKRADAGHRITVRVTGSRKSYTAVKRTSSAVTIR